jgi:hypothetical protein
MGWRASISGEASQANVQDPVTGGPKHDLAGDLVAQYVSDQLDQLGRHDRLDGTLSLGQHVVFWCAPDDVKVVLEIAQI